MSDDEIARLAQQAGIAVDWTDAAGHAQRVAPQTLRRLLAAFGLPCETSAQMFESLDRVREESARVPSLVTADVGRPITLPVPGGRRAELVLEGGSRQNILLEENGPGRSRLAAVSSPGYHMLNIGDQALTLAVAPDSCFTIEDAAPRTRLWGLAIQLYGLRRGGDGGIGDTRALGQLAKSAAQAGADAIALSPTHALFSADPAKYSPYAPSSRLAFNPLFADLDLVFGADWIDACVSRLGLSAERARLEAGDLIDWPAAAAAKFTLLRHLFEAFWSLLQDQPNASSVRDFLEFRRAGGEILEHHARFEALYAKHFEAGPAHADWRQWPAELQDAAGPAVAAFAASHSRDVAFHVFMQWLAERSMASAQAEARSAGMRIGLISDLAVGMDSSGSHAWSRQNDVLVGLNIGAPPDLFNAQGQNWGLTSFSPRALVGNRFEPFLATLRAAMRHGGGVRIDHVMGLTRLWLIPEGAPPTQGAYLTYPFADLLRLIRLESARHRAIVIGEDLGTVPEGFQEKLSAAGVAGMDVLWFMRAGPKFAAPKHWRGDAIAMTTTHDLPTVTGWWSATDIDLRKGLGLAGSSDEEADLRQGREDDKKELWEAFEAAGATSAPVPAAEDLAQVVDAAVKFVAATPAPLMLLPLEDLLGLAEQPNLPGTIDEYPNWRRRYRVPVGQIFTDPVAAARARSLTGRRSQ